jgi:hypothetical protein
VHRSWCKVPRLKRGMTKLFESVASPLEKLSRSD